MTEPREHLGAPDIRLAGFQLWVHGRQFPKRRIIGMQIGST